MRAVDLFAGLGGSTEGATAAGAEVVWAANHWRLAVDTHALNHPHTIHECQDLKQANWLDMPEHDLVMASPCCQGHSVARGKDKKQHDESRSTAWAVVDCLDCHRSKFFIVENVEEFQNWVLYPMWCGALEALGYKLQTMVLDAADHGVAQNRERLFIVGTLGNHSINLKLNKREHIPASSVIDFESGSWSMVNKPGRAQNTLNRIAKGREQFGSTFLAPYYGSGSGKTGRSINRPIGTLTTRDRWALVDGDRMRMLTLHEQKQLMGFRSDYKIETTRQKGIHLLGNAVSPPVMRDVVTALMEAA